MSGLHFWVCILMTKVGWLSFDFSAWMIFYLIIRRILYCKGASFLRVLSSKWSSALRGRWFTQTHSFLVCITFATYLFPPGFFIFLRSLPFLIISTRIRCFHTVSWITFFVVCNFQSICGGSWRLSLVTGAVPIFLEVLIRESCFLLRAGLTSHQVI